MSKLRSICIISTVTLYYSSALNSAFITTLSIITCIDTKVIQNGASEEKVRAIIVIRAYHYFFDYPRLSSSSSYAFQSSSSLSSPISIIIITYYHHHCYQVRAMLTDMGFGVSRTAAAIEAGVGTLSGNGYDDDR